VTAAQHGRRFGEEAGIVMAAILQHAAPDTYSGQWPARFSCKSSLYRRSIDRNDRAASTLFTPLPSNVRQNRGNDSQTADGFSSGAK
jgi:hypothetical protein